eukprot:TRINITY_DN55296_c0_g1_i1.p1 TRINITY_DN55296_c0_g1~~TRINITY_DN55296_c0_g1_i1.p1  ORF type:complete len:546 (-),score=52.65 TRINITY_DN55296_c0_g1_i1:72-1607(-)
MQYAVSVSWLFAFGISQVFATDIASDPDEACLRDTGMPVRSISMLQATARVQATSRGDCHQDESMSVDSGVDKCSSFENESECHQPNCFWWDHCWNLPQKWPNRTVTYFFDMCDCDTATCKSALEGKDWIEAAMRRIENVTCLSFREIQHPIVLPAEPTLRLHVPQKWFLGSSDPGSTHCTAEASVGASKSAYMYISEACNHNTISFPSGVSDVLRELVRVLGFQYEHVSPTRDQQMSVKWSNIDESMWDSFKIKLSVDLFGHRKGFIDSCDLSSILMFHSYELAKDDGKPSLLSFDHGTLCKNRRMSAADIERIQNVYGCGPDLPACESEHFVEDAMKQCTCGRNTSYAKCGGCSLPLQHCAIEDCLVAAECDVGKTCAVARRCERPKTCTVYAPYDGWIVSNWWQTVSDPAKCGWENISSGSECGWENVTDATICGSERITNSEKCGTKAGYGSHQCGYRPASVPGECGYEWVTDRKLCGSNFRECYLSRKTAKECGWGVTDEDVKCFP